MELTPEQIQSEEAKVVDLVVNQGLSTYKALKETKLNYKSRTREYYNLNHKISRAKKAKVANKCSQQGITCCKLFACF